MSSSPTLLNLPMELLCNILIYCESIHEIISMRLTCKQLKQVSHSRSLWDYRLGLLSSETSSIFLTEGEVLSSSELENASKGYLQFLSAVRSTQKHPAWLIRKLPIQANWKSSVALIPGGRYLLTVSDNSTIQLWDLGLVHPPFALPVPGSELRPLAEKEVDLPHSAIPWPASRCYLQDILVVPGSSRVSFAVICQTGILGAHGTMDPTLALACTVTLSRNPTITIHGKSRIGRHRPSVFHCFDGFYINKGDRRDDQVSVKNLRDNTIFRWVCETTVEDLCFLENGYVLVLGFFALTKDRCVKVFSLPDSTFFSPIGSKNAAPAQYPSIYTVQLNDKLQPPLSIDDLQCSIRHVSPTTESFIIDVLFRHKAYAKSYIVRKRVCMSTPFSETWTTVDLPTVTTDIPTVLGAHSLPHYEIEIYRGEVKRLRSKEIIETVGVLERHQFSSPERAGTATFSPLTGRYCCMHPQERLIMVYDFIPELS
ncbi:hypothetical protein DL96DRAFT_1707903 [Flagelloscypha sp. PMI_526]|nr:hypothetical protein DL96DRAFT_1707903 [Flagelloscypha sp. PMI_526]